MGKYFSPLFNSLCGGFWWFTVSGQILPLDYRCILIASVFCGFISDCPLGLPHSLKYGGETSAEWSQGKWHLNFFFFLIISFTILFICFFKFHYFKWILFSTGLARKFVQVCPQDVTGKAKQTFWPAQDLLSETQCLSPWQLMLPPFLKTHTRWLPVYLLCPLWLNRWGLSGSQGLNTAETGPLHEAVRLLRLPGREAVFTCWSPQPHCRVFWSSFHLLVGTAALRDHWILWEGP